MCVALYLASNKKLPHIAPRAGKFYTCDLEEKESIIKTHFSFPYVIYLASDQGCGCGFSINHYIDTDNYSNNILPLAYYLLEALKVHRAQIELFMSYFGEQSTPPRNRKILTIEDFLDVSEFPLSDGDFATIISK